MSEQIRISAKNLGAVALPNFCPRCFWLKLRLRNRLPYQIFPGIFSSIDAYTKHVVHGWFDAHGSPPPWLAELGDIVGYCEPPHWSRFNIVDKKHNILLTGVPDGIFVRTDCSHVIADYKTARFTSAQDELLPMYEVQLNAYAVIAEQCGFDPVRGLTLIYMEPVTEPPIDAAATCNKMGFQMGFSAHVLNVEIDRGLIDPLLARTRGIVETDQAPVGRLGCKDCAQVDRMMDVLAERPDEDLAV